MQNLVLLYTVSMGVFSAGFGPNVINRTIVVHTQKWTRQLLQDPVLVFIYAQIGGLKGRRFHAEMFSDALAVSIGPKGSGRFAAIGTIKAINLSKSLLVKPVYHRI